MVAQVKEFFGTVPMTFKRNAALKLGVLNLQNIFNRFFYFKHNNDHTSNLDLTLASTRNRVLRHTSNLTPLEHLVMALLCDIAIARVETKLEGEQILTTAGGISSFYHTVPNFITKGIALVVRSSAFLAVCPVQTIHVFIWFDKQVKLTLHHPTVWGQFYIEIKQILLNSNICLGEHHLVCQRELGKLSDKKDFTVSHQIFTCNIKVSHYSIDYPSSYTKISVQQKVFS